MGSRGSSPTSVIQGNLPLYSGAVFGRPLCCITEVDSISTTALVQIHIHCGWTKSISHFLGNPGWTLPLVNSPIKGMVNQPGLPSGATHFSSIHSFRVWLRFLPWVAPPSAAFRRFGTHSASARPWHWRPGCSEFRVSTRQFPFLSRGVGGGGSFVAAAPKKDGCQHAVFFVFFFQGGGVWAQESGQELICGSFGCHMSRKR